MNTETPARKATMTGLAVIGFLALIVLGLWLALAAARSIPSAGGDLGAVATYIGSMFTPKPGPSLTVVPSSTTTISFGTGSTTPSTSVGTSTPATASTTVKKPVAVATGPTYYRTVQTTYPTPGATQIQVPKTYSGLPDLVVSITDVGYIDSSGNFVASSTMNHSQKLAAQILVVNNGTNKTGSWTIQVSVPTTSNANLTDTETMDSLDPNQPLLITLELSRGTPRIGTDTITAVADPNNSIAETTKTNNTASATITVQ